MKFVQVVLECVSILIIVYLANSLYLEVIASGMSFIYARNSIGPSTEPCGTPEVTGASLET